MLATFYHYSSQTHQQIAVVQTDGSAFYMQAIGGKLLAKKQAWSTTLGDQINYKFSTNVGLKRSSADSFGHKLNYQYSNNGIAGIATSGANLSYSYDSLGQAQSINRSQGVATINGYSAMGNLNVIRLKGRTQRSTPTRPLPTDIKYRYSFNPDHNVTSMTVTSGGQTIGNYHYVYNVQNQLSGYSNLGKSKQYQYGLNNNFASNANNQYYYNLNQGLPNQLKHVGLGNPGYSYYPNGQIQTDPKKDAYTYNDLNQLISYQQYDANKVVTYNYLNGLEAGETVNNQTIHFIRNNQAQVVGEVEGTSSSFNLPGLWHIYNNQIEDLYAIRQGSIVAIGYNGVINDVYQYTPYGIQSGNKHQTIGIKQNLSGYTGQQKDPETGLMMLGGFRNYNPSLGRFIQTDTYNSFSNPGVNNNYAYVQSNPLAGVDPTGHCGCFDFFFGSSEDSDDDVGNGQAPATDKTKLLEDQQQQARGSAAASASSSAAAAASSYGKMPASGSNNSLGGSFSSRQFSLGVDTVQEKLKELKLPSKNVKSVRDKAWGGAHTFIFELEEVVADQDKRIFLQFLQEKGAKFGMFSATEKIGSDNWKKLLNDAGISLVDRQNNHGKYGVEEFASPGRQRTNISDLLEHYQQDQKSFVLITSNRHLYSQFQNAIQW